MSHFCCLHSSLPHPTNSARRLYLSSSLARRDCLPLPRRSLLPTLRSPLHQPSFRPLQTARLLDIESTEVAAAVASPSLPRGLYSVSQRVYSVFLPRARVLSLPIGDPATRPMPPLPPSCSVDRFIAGVCPPRFYPHHQHPPSSSSSSFVLCSLSLSLSRSRRLLLFSLCSSFRLLHLRSIRSL